MRVNMSDMLPISYAFLLKLRLHKYPEKVQAAALGGPPICEAGPRLRPSRARPLPLRPAAAGPLK
ncbi:hypothetical protein FQA47_014155 [Oryzias melastigma]|uniref:Uncharacterized protein n=1 Tax=Oryzias melastigma TaxID=30732 RepID=A0A834BY18_ORYME|nr:hypothetical protein FQA47_014155 [Oryzias melastigma]